MKFKAASRETVVKRLRKRIELQEESSKRVNMEAWRNALYKRSEYDELTGVLNRRGIRKYMVQAFSDAKAVGNKFAVLIIDVDFFKEYNDTYGHVAGDEFLLAIGGSQTMSVMEAADKALYDLKKNSKNGFVIVESLQGEENDKEIEKKCEKVIEYRFSDPRKAYNICSEILEHGISNEEAYEVAYARLYMGDTMFSMGEFQKALANMMLAKKVQEKYGYQDLLMKTYNIIAIIYVNQGDDLLGLDYYYKSLKLARECGNKVMMRMVYNNIGALLNNAGDAAGAAEYFRKVYELCQKREQRDSKKIDNKKQYLVNLAVGYLGEKKYKQARKYLDMASMESDGKSQDCCSAAEINRIVDSVRVYVETGNKAAAIKEAENILSLPEKILKM